MKVWVIMGNDYPDAVRLTKRAADRYVERMKAENRKSLYAGSGGKIYWRHYEFTVPMKGNNKK
jgi:hypothetical protein